MSEFIHALVGLLKGHEGAVAPSVIEAPDGSGDRVVAVRRDVAIATDDGARIAPGWSLERIAGPREPRALHELTELASFLAFAKEAGVVFVHFDDALRGWAFEKTERLDPHVVSFTSKVVERSAWWLDVHNRPLDQQAAVRSLLLFGDAIITGRVEILTALSSLGTKGNGEASSQVDGTGNQRLSITKGAEETVVRVPERIEIQLALADPDCPVGMFPVFPFVRAADRQVAFTATGIAEAKLDVARALAQQIRDVVGDEVPVYVGAPAFRERPIRPAVAE